MKKSRLFLFLLGIPLALVITLVVVNVLDKSKIHYQDIAKHGEDISIIVAFGESSAHRRFVVYDNGSQKVVSSSKCAHGSGGGSTWDKPVFSNKVGSMCSSLGEYKLKNVSLLYNCGLRCIRLDGLSASNSNAALRGITIHEVPLFADAFSVGTPIPTDDYISQGCFGISTETFELLCDMLNSGKTVYLYAHEEKL